MVGFCVSFCVLCPPLWLVNLILKDEKDSPTFATAMKVFAKLDEPDMVNRIWLES